MALAGLGAGLAGLGAWHWFGRTDGSLDAVRAAGRLRVGYAVEAPYAQVLADGSVSGESIEVARAVAAALGVQVQWIQTDFERLISDLEGGRFHLIAAGMFIREERARRVAFTRPTLRVRPGWLVAAGNPAGLGTIAQLRTRRDVRIAVIAGSAEQASLRGAGLTQHALLEVPDAQTGLAAVSAGRVDALALSMPAVSEMAGRSGGRLVAVPALARDDVDDRPDRVALAVRRNDRSLLEAIDEVLAQYLGSRPHLIVLARFGLGRDDLPPSPAAVPTVPQRHGLRG